MKVKIISSISTTVLEQDINAFIQDKYIQDIQYKIREEDQTHIAFIMYNELDVVEVNNIRE